MKNFTIQVVALIALCIYGLIPQPPVRTWYDDHSSIPVNANTNNTDQEDAQKREPPPDLSDHCQPTEAPTVATTEPTKPAETEHQHSYEVVSEFATSCVEAGWTEYRCSCGEGYSVEIPLLDHEYVPGQTVEPACTEQGYTVYVCSGCDATYNGDFTDPIGHTYEQRYYAPTFDARGYTEYTCTRCGYTYQDDFIDKLILNEETVYAICTVNIRSGPSTGYAILDSLTQGESIQKLADYNDFWSLVQYGNTRAYIYSEYLSTKKPAPTHSYEYFGTFSIPSVGVKVDCYKSNTQEVVDAPNSAALFLHQDHDVIADHANQDFYKIKRCTPGTIAYLITPDGTQEYVCVDIIQGHNDGKLLTDENYNKITNIYPGSLVCYTCNDCWQNVTLVFFEEVSISNE